MIQRKLTSTQRTCVEILRSQGWYMAARAAQDTWDDGRKYVLDKHVTARGVRRLMRHANWEVEHYYV